MLHSLTNSTAAFFRRAQDQMADLRQTAETLERQISTGERLERSSDDPVASARLRTLERADRLAQIDAGNAALAREELTGASTHLDDIANTLIRARELAVQAGSDTVSQEGRLAIATEMEILRDSLFASINATSSTGRSLFGGDTSRAAYTMNATGTAIYTGALASGTIPVAQGVRIDRGVTGPAVLNFDDGGTQTDALAFLQSFTAALRGGAADPSGFARDALAGFDAAIDTTARNQTVLGARAAWIDTIENTQILRSESRAREAGEIGGTDLASAISRLQQVLTTLEASQAGFARLSSLTLFDNI